MHVPKHGRNDVQIRSNSALFGLSSLPLSSYVYRSLKKHTILQYLPPATNKKKTPTYLFKMIVYEVWSFIRVSTLIFLESNRSCKVLTVCVVLEPNNTSDAKAEAHLADSANKLNWSRDFQKSRLYTYIYMIFLRTILIQLLIINCSKIERKSNKCAMQYTNEKHYSSKCKRKWALRNETKANRETNLYCS